MFGTLTRHQPTMARRGRWRALWRLADGVVQGLVEAPKAPHVSEQKTHNDKSFKNVRSKVCRIQAEHYAQMQVYMHLMDIDRALYQAVNKMTMSSTLSG